MFEVESWKGARLLVERENRPRREKLEKKGQENKGYSHEGRIRRSASVIESGVK